MAEVSGFEGLTLPEGQSFNDHLHAVFRQDLKDREREFYPIPPKLDLLDIDTRLWRFDKGSARHYYEPDKEVFFPSQTTVQMYELKDSQFLTDWKIRMAMLMDDEDAPNQYRDERAQFGNLEHIVQTEMLLFGGIDLSIVPDIVNMYRDIHELYHFDVRSWIPELKRDLTAFGQWIYEYKIEPIAVEIPITYPIKDKYGNVLLWVAGTIDLVAKAQIPRKDFHGEVYKTNGGKYGDKGDPKKTTEKVEEIIVTDYKSGKKGFYKGHEVQVDTYLYGWNDLVKRTNMEQFKADSCWNYAPKDSTGSKPTFHFTEQTEKKGREYMPHLVELFKLDGHHEIGDVRDVQGFIEIGKSAKKNVQKIPANEYMKKHYEQTDREVAE